MQNAIVISRFQAEQILKNKKAKQKQATISPDLGITQVEVTITDMGVVFPGGEILPWDDVKRISKSKNNCFLVAKGTCTKVIKFSQESNKPFSLMPTKGAPTMLVAGFTMHRIVGSTPDKDTLDKINALKPIAGHILDTNTGLGYTAIEASITADTVVTIEIDPAALEIARLNPWSARLFNNHKIKQIIGDSFDVVDQFDPGSFDCIIHDPPSLQLAGHLYSLEFYQKLYKILKKGGKIFHYIGNPQSKFGGKITAGVNERLLQAGFIKIKSKPKAFGLVAYK